MGYRSECPACKSYTSNVYSAIHHSCSDCPYCGCPYETLVQWQEMNETINKCKENIEKRNFDKKLEDLFCENAKLKSTIKRMKDLVAFINVLEPIINVIKILEECDD